MPEARCQYPAKWELGLVGVGQIENVNRLAIDNGAARHGASGDRNWVLWPRCLECAVIGRDVKHVAIDEDQGRAVGLAKASRTLDDRVENPLEVGRRLADDTQDLGGRCLLLKGLCELTVACL